MGGSARCIHACSMGAGVVPQSPRNHTHAHGLSVTTCGRPCVPLPLSEYVATAPVAEPDARRTPAPPPASLLL